MHVLNADMLRRCVRWQEIELHVQKLIKHVKNYGNGSAILSIGSNISGAPLNALHYVYIFCASPRYGIWRFNVILTRPARCTFQKVSPAMNFTPKLLRINEPASNRRFKNIQPLSRLFETFIPV